MTLIQILCRFFPSWVVLNQLCNITSSNSSNSSSNGPPIVSSQLISEQCINETLAFSSNNNDNDIIQNASQGSPICYQDSGTFTCDFGAISSRLQVACNQVGGAYYEAKSVSLVCGSYHSQPALGSFYNLNYGLCIGTNCSQSEFETLALLMGEADAQLQGFDSCRVLINGTIVGTNPPSGSSSQQQQQCQIETATLDQQTDYSDYNATLLTCDNITNTCVQQFPVDRAHASCASRGGIFYTGDLYIDCSNVTVELINSGMCIATDCTLDWIEELYNQTAQDGALEFIKNSSYFQNCTGRGENIQPVMNQTVTPTTGKPTTVHPTTITMGPTTMHPTTVHPTSMHPTTVHPTTVRPATITPGSYDFTVPPFSSCQEETRNLNRKVDYSDYNTTPTLCNQTTHVCTEVFPASRSQASCSSLNGTFYIGDIFVDCTSQRVELLHVGTCTTTVCASSYVNDWYNETAADTAMRLSDQHQDCVGSATNVQTFLDWQCEMESWDLDNQTDYADYDNNMTWNFDRDTKIGIMVYPVDRARASCISLGGIFYTGDIFVGCDFFRYESLDIGFCTAVDCTLGPIYALYNQIAADNAAQQMSKVVDPPENCIGVAKNVKPSQATNASDVAVTSTKESASQRPTPYHIRSNITAASAGNRRSLASAMVVPWTMIGFMATIMDVL